MSKKVRTSELVSHFSLEVLAGEEGLNRPITSADLHRPGLVLAGFSDHYAKERVQLLGMTELSFFSTLPETERLRRAEMLCQAETPCLIVSRQMEVPPEIYEATSKHHVPLLRSSMTTTRLASRLTGFLENRLAPSTTIHGVLVDIYGVGMLITGASGIGKSETALELVKRGHRLVADDAVEIRQTADNELHGNAPELIKNLLEIRGLGIINVMTLFGVGAVRNMKKISAVARLEAWQPDKQYDRLGLDEEKTKIIDTELPLITIPVRPGRNLAIIIEVAAMNYRLKNMGYNAAQQFTMRLTQSISEDYDEME